MTRCLIVNADDFGLTPGVCLGILQAHLEGIVTSTSVMANLPGAPQAAAKARQQAGDLGWGVHLNLTRGNPVSPPETVPDLVDSAGHFWDFAELLRRVETLDPDQVRREWQAQISAICPILPVDHLDSHHFCAELSQATWRLYLALAAEHRLAVRAPRPPKLGRQPLQPDVPGAPEFDRAWAKSELASSGVVTTDGLRLDFFGEDANQPLLDHMLRDLPHGVTEVMTHPGLFTPDLADTSDYAQNRQVELGILTSQATRQRVEESAIRLVRFADGLPG
jgi:predicted glycoside hydrolase/deacetylase ChbG (UPF0249 family)